jgi:hypothetical protein
MNAGMAGRTAIAWMLFVIDPEALPIAEGPVTYPVEVLAEAVGAEDEVRGLLAGGWQYQGDGTSAVGGGATAGEDDHACFDVVVNFSKEFANPTPAEVAADIRRCGAADMDPHFSWADRRWGEEESWGLYDVEDEQAD